MRVAYLCKRQYMRKDVIADRYARLYEQPRQLALRGHTVLGLCLSYRQVPECDEYHEAAPGSLRWLGFSQNLFGFLGYPRRVERALREFAPDVLVAASDCLHVILGSWLARRLGVVFAVDLYDDFATFGLSRVPAVRTLYRRAIRGAAVVSCVSGWLARVVRDEYGAIGKVIVLPSTIERELFRPLDRDECRARLGLPVDALLVGTAGGLHADKGILPLYDAFTSLARQEPRLHLVLAGGFRADCPPPSGENVHYLGELPHDRAAELFNALDVGVVYLRDTPYGRASFPQKLYEMVACGLPVAVARVGEMGELLARAGECLYEPDDGESLARCLRAQLSGRVQAGIDLRDWGELAADMERAYLASLA